MSRFNSRRRVDHPYRTLTVANLLGAGNVFDKYGTHLYKGSQIANIALLSFTPLLILHPPHSRQAWPSPTHRTAESFTRFPALNIGGTQSFGMI